MSAHIDQTCDVSEMVSEKNSIGIGLAKKFDTGKSLEIGLEKRLVPKKVSESVLAKFIVHVTYCIEYTMTQHIQRIRTGWVEVGAGHNGLSYYTKF